MAGPYKPLLKIMSLWRKNPGTEKEYFSGIAGKLPPGFELKEGTKVLIFMNKKPSKANSPTHFLMVEKPAEAEPAKEEEKYHVEEPPKDDVPDFG